MLRTLRALLPYMTAVLVIAALYTGWIMISRYDERRAADRQAKEDEVKAARRIVDRLGGGKLKILSFWTEPASVKRGGRALVCYSVSNARSVRIDPHIENITPSISRCLEAFPKRTTEYRLTAEDSEGRVETASIVLKVK